MKKGVESKGSVVKRLNLVQREVLLFLTEEYLTPRQISIRRGTSLQAVYNVIAKLKKKGLISGNVWGGFKKSEPLRRGGFNLRHGIRLHGQEFNIKILFRSTQYQKLLSKSNYVYFDNNTIKLCKDSVEVYAGKDKSFMGEDIQRATALSFQYWNKFFRWLEDHLKVILIKPRSRNIKLVNNHYAEINNEIAKECNVNKEKISIYTTEDGKLWFKIDNSFQLNEAESLHPQTAKEDMQKVKATFNDLRDKPSYLPSEIKATVDTTLALVKEVATAQLNQTKLMEAMLPKPPKEEKVKGRVDYIL